MKNLFKKTVKKSTTKVYKVVRYYCNGSYNNEIYEAEATGLSHRGAWSDDQLFGVYRRDFFKRPLRSRRATILCDTIKLIKKVS